MTDTRPKSDGSV